MNTNNPSKYLSLCLSSLQTKMKEKGVNCFINEEDSLFSCVWGVDFLHCYTYGRNVLDTSGNSCDPKQIAWISSVAADSMLRKEKNGAKSSHPYFLFIVSSSAESKKVCSVCKLLKKEGFHTLRIHSDYSIDLQIDLLKGIKPEFLVATPETLLELISLRAINLSEVSFLIIDETGTSPNSDFTLKVESIKEALPSNPFTVLFSASWHNHNYEIFNTLLSDPVSRISSNTSLASLGAFIRQSIYTCSSEHEKILKFIQVLKELRKKNQTLEALCVVPKAENSNYLKKLLVANNFCVSEDEESDFDCDADTAVVYLTEKKYVLDTDLEDFDAVLLVDFVDPEDVYPQIVMKMARNSKNGVLFSFLKEENCLQASKLIRVLEECGHEVPDCLLRTMCIDN